MALIFVAVDVVALILATAWALVMLGNRALLTPFTEWLGSQLGGLLRPLVAAADTFNGWITDAYDAAFQQAVTPLAHFIVAIPHHSVQLADEAILLFRAIVYEVRGHTGAAVNATMPLVEATIAAALGPLWDFARFINDVRIPNTEWFISAVQAELWDAWHRLRGETYQADLALGASIETNRLAGEAALGVAIDGERSDRAAADAGIEAGIDAKVGALGASIDGDIHAQVDPLASEIAGVRSALADAIPGIDERIGAAAAAAALAGTAAVAITTTVTDWIHECGEPLCTHFGPEIPFISAFNDLLTLGLIAGLVGDAIAEPEAAARRIEGMVAGPIAVASGVFTAMGARR